METYVNRSIRDPFALLSTQNLARNRSGLVQDKEIASEYVKRQQQATNIGQPNASALFICGGSQRKLVMIATVHSTVVLGVVGIIRYSIHCTYVVHLQELIFGTLSVPTCIFNNSKWKTFSLARMT